MAMTRLDHIPAAPSPLKKLARKGGHLDTGTHNYRVFVQAGDKPVQHGRFSSLECAAESAIILAKAGDCFVLGGGKRWDKPELAEIVRVQRLPERRKE